MRPISRADSAIVAIVFLIVGLPASAQVRDSAGVQIFEERTPRSESAGWVVEVEPDLVIGQVDGLDEYMLVNPLEAVALSNGTIVVQNSNGSVFEIRYYDVEGRHIVTASRLGEGPYEFERANGLHVLPGDSVLVVGRDGRYAVFGPTGERVRDGRFTSAVASANRTYLVQADRLGLLDSAPDGDTGVRRDLMTLDLYDTDDGELRRVTEGEGRAVYFERIAGGTYVYETPFSPDAYAAAGRGLAWFGQSDLSDIGGYDASGALRYIIRRSYDPPEVSRDQRGMFREEMLRVHPMARHRSYARRMDYPNAMPLHHGLEVDGAGRLWVLRYEPPWSEEPLVWDAYADGIYERTVSMPSQLLPRCVRAALIQCRVIRWVDEDFVLLQSVGPFDVPQISRHRIRRVN